MKQQVYLCNLEWDKIHDNVGGVVGDIVFKNAISLEDFKNIRSKTYLLLEESQEDEIERLNNIINELEKENEILKHRLNDIIFDDANNDVELGARYLKKIGYIDFDEDRKVYINKHNNEPFWQEDEREKGYYISDEELDEYTKQLEYQLQQKENIIKEVREYINWRLEEHQDMYKYQMEELLEILDKGE